MKTLLVAAMPLLATVGVSAVPVERAIVAAMQLSVAPNYSWTCSVTDDARTYDIEGKTANGITWQRQPMPKTVAKRVGRDGGYFLESMFTEPHRYVILTSSGWQRLEELPEHHSDWQEDTEWLLVSMPLLRTPDMPADEWGTDPFGLPPAVYVPIIRAQEDDPDERVYSNYQFALSLPHQELSVIVSSHVDMQVEDNVASGMLSDLGAQLLLVHDGHEYIRPVIATGRFKLWLRENFVQQYTVELAGIVVVDRKAVYVRQKSTTRLANVGATAFDVPDDAWQRLRPEP